MKISFPAFLRHLLLFTGLGLLVALPLTSCGGPTEPDEPEINEDILLIRQSRRGTEQIRSSLLMGAWAGNRMYATRPTWVLEIGNDLRLGQDSLLLPLGTGRPVNFIELSGAGSRLLYVPSLYSDASLGGLYEMNLDTGRRHILRDSSYAVGSAVYLPGSNDSKLVYYSYGSSPRFGNEGRSLTPGYYLLDTETGADSLLLEHISPAGPSEMVNGFDISPDGRTLLIPDVRASRTTFRPPQIVAYDLQAQTADTLDVPFELAAGARIGLWLRYSPDGSQILYCNIPLGAYGHTAHGGSEVGVIERGTNVKRVLDVNTDPGGQSVQLAPTWSPSGAHIVYGSGPLTLPRGALGHYSLYVLKLS